MNAYCVPRRRKRRRIRRRKRKKRNVVHLSWQIGFLCTSRKMAVVIANISENEHRFRGNKIAAVWTTMAAWPESVPDREKKRWRLILGMLMGVRVGTSGTSRYVPKVGC